MTNSAKTSPRKSYYLPGDPSRTPLTQDEFRDIMRPFWKQRKQLQRAGECNAPARHVGFPVSVGDQQKRKERRHDAPVRYAFYQADAARLAVQNFLRLGIHLPQIRPEIGVPPLETIVTFTSILRCSSSCSASACSGVMVWAFNPSSRSATAAIRAAWVWSPYFPSCFSPAFF